MGVRTKTLVAVLMVGAVIGIVILQVENKGLFKGQILEGPSDETAVTAGELPDLRPKLEVLAPETAGGDIIAKTTIENIGAGSVIGGQPFRYAIYINDTEVFSNSDSYSALDPGDSFTFKYPIPRTIYNYGNSGTVSVILDTDKSIKESDESNNTVEVQY
ncbi:MAG: CARDB domain-containing protein [Candidatus Peregrinibacteria bacterium]